MFPMGGMNPKNMQRMMRQMGIEPDELACTRVVFEQDGKKLVMENPTVTVMSVQGQKTYLVNGEIKEESAGFSAEDVSLVASSANVSEAKAQEALKKADGDLAKAIEALKK
ncbi:MAG: nascent polypeptide-associated complex protein [Candidatus Diapherotrites archaeon]|nr:nascent polypeptide-associated complex protein [Candidatus Diapherotrites archaeon]